MSSSSFCCTARCVALSGDCDSRRSCKICCKPLCSGCQFILVCNLEKFHVTCYQFKGNVWKISLFFRTKWKDKNSWNWRVFVNIQTFDAKNMNLGSYLILKSRLGCPNVVEISLFFKILLFRNFPLNSSSRGFCTSHCYSEFSRQKPPKYFRKRQTLFYFD